MRDDSQDLDDIDTDQDDGDEFADAIPCSFCGKPVYEEAEICPYCGEYISREDTSLRKPLWVVVGAGVCVAVIVIVWVLKSL